MPRRPFERRDDYCRFAVALITATIVAAAGCEGPAPSAQQAAHAATANNATTSATDLTGKPVDPFEHASDKAIVLIFMRVDCPICGRYAPEIRRLIEKNAQRAVRFYLVYPVPEDTPAAIRQQLAEFGLPSAALCDPGHALVRRCGATITPEAAVFAANADEPAYRGRIDDLYEDFGRRRAAATTHDLETAIDAVLSGQRPQLPMTRAVGCYISETP
jgi:hypothetical protein